LPRLPIKPLVAVVENAKEYPSISHCTIHTAFDAETTQINDRADLRLTRPAYKNAEFQTYDVSRWTKSCGMTALTETGDHKQHL
jgi:hypothetical protein